MRTRTVVVLLVGVVGLLGFAPPSPAQGVPSEEDIILDPTGGRITVVAGDVTGRGAALTLRKDVADGKYEIWCGEDAGGNPIKDWTGVSIERADGTRTPLAIRKNKETKRLTVYVGRSVVTETCRPDLPLDCEGAGFPELFYGPFRAWEAYKVVKNPKTGKEDTVTCPPSGGDPAEIRLHPIP